MTTSHVPGPPDVADVHLARVDRPGSAAYSTSEVAPANWAL